LQSSFHFARTRRPEIRGKRKQKCPEPPRFVRRQVTRNDNLGEEIRPERKTHWQAGRGRYGKDPLSRTRILRADGGIFSGCFPTRLSISFRRPATPHLKRRRIFDPADKVRNSSRYPPLILRKAVRCKDIRIPIAIADYGRVYLDSAYVRVVRDLVQYLDASRLQTGSRIGVDHSLCHTGVQEF